MDEGCKKNRWKEYTFSVIDRILDEQSGSFYVEIWLIIIETMQLIGLIASRFLTKNAFAEILMNVCKWFLFVPYFEGGSSNSMYTFAVYSVALSIPLLLTLCFVSMVLLNVPSLLTKATRSSEYAFIFKFWATVTMLLSTVLYTPMLELMFSIFRCESNAGFAYSKTESESTSFNSVTREVCLGGSSSNSILLAIFSILGILLLFKFVQLFNSLFFDMRLDCKYQNSRINGQYECNLQYFITFYTLANTFLLESKYELITILIACVALVAIAKDMRKTIKYNDQRIQFCKNQQLIVILWTCVIDLYDYVDGNNVTLIYFWVLGILGFSLCNYFDEPITEERCAANSSNYSFAQEAFAQLRVLCYAIMRYESYSWQMDGFLNRHRNDCILTTCPSRSSAIRLKKFNRMLVKPSKNEDQIMSHFVIFTVFNIVILKFKDNNDIRLLYALFLLESIQNKEQALIQLQFLSQNSPSLAQEFAIFRLNRIIDDNHENLNDKQHDYSLEISVDDLSNKMRKKIGKIVQNLISFWQEVAQQEPNGDIVISKGIEAFLEIDETCKQFEYQIQHSSINKSAIQAYSMFCLQILDDKERTQAAQRVHRHSLLMNPNDFNHHGSNSNLNDGNNAGDDDDDEEVPLNSNRIDEVFTPGIVTISSSEENFGVITDVNQEIVKIVGISKSSLINKSVNQIIPNMWASQHNHFIDSYLATGEKKILGVQQETFLRNRQDYAFPVRMVVKQIPSNSAGMQFAALIYSQNLLYEYTSYFITAPNGKIETVSPSAIPMFNIEMKKVRQGLYIEKIVPQFWEYFGNFSEGSGKIITIKTFKNRMMKDSEVRVHISPIKYLNMTTVGYIVSVALVNESMSSKICLTENQTERSFMSNASQSNNGISLGMIGKTIQQDQLKESDEIEKSDDDSSSDDDDDDSAEGDSNRMGSDMTVRRKKAAKKKDFVMELYFDLRTLSYQGVYLTKKEAESNSKFQFVMKSFLHDHSPQNSPSSKSTGSNHFSSVRKSIANGILQNRLNRAECYRFLYSDDVQHPPQSLANQGDNSQDITAKNGKKTTAAISTATTNGNSEEVKVILEKLVEKQKQMTKAIKRSKLSGSQSTGTIPKRSTQLEIPTAVFYLNHLDLHKAHLNYFKHIDALMSEYEEEMNKRDLLVDHPDKDGWVVEDFSGGIKTCRLEGENIRDIGYTLCVDENSEGDEESDRLNQEDDIINEQNQSNEGEFQKDVDKLISSKRNLRQLLGDSESDSNWKSKLVRQAFFVLVFLGLIGLIVNGLVSFNNSLDGIVKRFEMLRITNMYLADSQSMVNELFKGIAIDKGFFFNTTDITRQKQELEFQKVLAVFSVFQYEIDQLITQVYLNQVGVTAEMFKIFAAGKDIYVITHFESSQTTINPTNLYQATQMILAKSYHLKRVPLGEFTIRNHDIFIMIENFSNQLLNRIIDYKTLQESEIVEFIDSTKNSISLRMALNMAIVLGCIACFMILCCKQMQQFYEIPQILTTIPQSQVRGILEKYESFSAVIIASEDLEQDELEQFDLGSEIASKKPLNIMNLPKTQHHIQKSTRQVEENNNMLSKKLGAHEKGYVFHGIENGLSVHGMSSMTKRKIKRSLVDWKAFVPFMLMLSTFIAIACTELLLQRSYASMFENYYAEISLLYSMEGQLAIMQNCAKSAVLGDKYIGVKQVYHPIDYLKKSVGEMNAMVDEIQRIHFENFLKLPEGYSSRYAEYFSENEVVCEELNSRSEEYGFSSWDLDECNSFHYGVWSRGLQVTWVLFVDQLVECAARVETKDIFVNPFQEIMSELMFKNELIVLYSRRLLRNLTRLFLEGISTAASNVKLISYAVTSTGIVLLFCNFVFVHLPTFQQISHTMFTFRNILQLIPRKITFKNHHIRSYILDSHMTKLSL